MEEADRSALIGLTAEIVSAYLTNNAVRTADVPDLLASIHGALSGLGSVPLAPVAEKRAPAVPVKKSITDDYIVCLDDGLKFKSLKRHLATLGMTPEDYRQKWGLPITYPMVAPNYAKTRSELARSMRLGRQREKATPLAEPVAVEIPAKKRGRAKAA